jgi:hypothetical protein
MQKHQVTACARQRAAVDSVQVFTQAELLRDALAWAIKDDIFAKLPRHGNTSWQPRSLVITAVLWVWSSQAKLTEAFAEAKQLSERLLGSVAIGSYQGLTQALVRHTERLMPLLWKRLQELMRQTGRSHFRIGRWLPLAVDGSRVTTPRTRRNEQALGAAHYGQGRKAKSRRKWKNKRRRSRPLGQPVKPQIWLTLLWHMGLKMPWAWRCGPSTASERGHLQELLQWQSFPENTLFCGDAGFVGYGVWSSILDAGHSFLIRVGSNLQLLRGLGKVHERNGLVHLWPHTAARQRQPPLTLRLLEFQTDQGPFYLVTNILSDRALSITQARKLYRLRWGVELQFRSLKQTFGRGKLRSRTPDRALVELEWSLLGLWLIQLFAVREQISMDEPPQRSSVALALSVIRQAMRDWSSPAPSPRALRQRLKNAVSDRYQRRMSKRGRYRPPLKDIPATGPPIIVRATPKQRQAYRQWKNTPRKNR